MYRGVTQVQATDDYELILHFDNQEIKIFNAKPVLSYGRFSELKDLHSFKKVHISFDTVEWDNGMDIDPEYLYKNSIETT